MDGRSPEGSVFQRVYPGNGADVYKRQLLANRTQAKAEALAARLEGMGAAVAVAENAGVAEEADYIFLGVKPQMMADMLGSIAPVLAARARAGRRFVLVTLAAGLTVARIREMARCV